MSDSCILFDASGGVATITLNRPDKLNSFNEAMHVELRDAVSRCEADAAIRAVLVTGAGRGFCAGQDLSDRNLGDNAPAPDLGDALGRNYNPLVKRLRALPKPVVCAVNGVAAGAGANFALACDIVLAARSAGFIQAFCKIGLVPDAGGTYALPRLVGQARAMGMAMLGDKISAEQAAEWGLIWKVYDDSDLMVEANTLCAHLATQPTRALALMKQALNASLGHTLDQQLELERSLQRVAGATEDFREGVKAFLEKRPAKFKGK
jgi:2-(1,2-epoxy-1,2-dihydrophenyl)acetyl-CoA isomerase